MFYTFLSTVFLMPVIAGWGNFLSAILGAKFSEISKLVLSGTLFLGIVLSVFTFFLPLNIYFEALVIAIGLTSFFFFKNYRSLYSPRTDTHFFLIVVVAILFFTSFYPIILDHFGYYVPTVLWLQNFGLTKGVANLDLLLGQMSFWHIFQAGFSNFADPFLRINAVAAIIYAVYIFEKKLWLHLCFLPFLFPFLSSPSPDLPAISFSLIILNECLSSDKNYEWLFGMSAFVFAIKPTMIWLPIFTFIYGFSSSKKITFSYIGICVFVLFFAKNCYCFGFPVFPAQIFDLGILWKPNPSILRTSAEVAISKTYDMQFTAAQISHFSSWDFIKNWLFLDGMKGKINLLLIFSLVTFSIFVFVKRQRVLLTLLLCVLTKVAVVLIFSAQYRFFLDVFFVLAAVLFFNKNSLKASVYIFLFLTLVFGIFFSTPAIITKLFPSFRLGKYVQKYELSQLYKPGTFKLNSYKTYQIGNCKFHVVQGYPFSFDTPPPTISPGFLQQDYNAGIFPQQLGKSPKDGYYWRRLSAQEKARLKRILSEVYK